MKTKPIPLTLSLCIFALTVPALAQESKESSGTSALETIVVTAQKRSENLQTVPISVSAVSGETLARQNITNITGLANSLPNVQINVFPNSPDSAIFSIRGVGTSDADPYVGTTVSVVVDGAVVGVNTAALLSLFDIERIEVLRGPQGTLFGANTTGGVVNVVTKQPTGVLGGEAQVSLGNYNHLDANAALNFPITDNLAGKVSILHIGRDGYFRNAVDGTKTGAMDTTALRAYLKYTGDVYNATLIAEYDRTRNDSQTGVNYSDSSLLFNVPGLTDVGPIFVRGQTNNQPNYNNRDSYSVTFTQNFATSIGDITAISSYRKYDHDLFSDDDAVPAFLLQTRRQIAHRQYSQEIRDDVKINERVRLIAGAFYLGQKYFLDQKTMIEAFGTGLGNPQTQDQKSDSISAFGQVYADLTDKLRFQLGARFAHEQTKATSTTGTSLNPNGPATYFGDPLIPGTFISSSGKKSWDKLGWKIGLDYKLNSDSMLYGYYARGFKSGGFTGRIVIAEDIGPHNPETLDTFEIGFKSDYLDNRLRTNLAVFYNNYKDMQVVQNITLSNGKNRAAIANAGKAETKGAELEVTAVPAVGLTLSASVAYLDAKYKEFDTGTGRNLAGQPLINAPKYSGSASVNWVIPAAAGKTTIFLQETFSSSKFTNFSDLPQEKVGSINLLNGTVSWAPHSDKWSVGLFGKNLTNKRYFAQKAWFAPVFGLANLGAPREYGVDFKYNW
jgi:iron complex outermembrane receptor protein